MRILSFFNLGDQATFPYSRTDTPIGTITLQCCERERDFSRERFFHKSIYISALAQEPYCSLPCLTRGSPNIDQAVDYVFYQSVRACVRACVFLCVCVCVCGHIREIKKLYIIPNLAFTVQKNGSKRWHSISFLYWFRQSVPTAGSEFYGTKCNCLSVYTALLTAHN